MRLTSSNFRLSYLLVCGILATFALDSHRALARAEDDAQRVVAQMLQAGRHIPNLRGDEKIQSVRNLAQQFIHVDGVADYALGVHRRAIAQEAQTWQAYRQAFATFLVHWMAAKLSRDFGVADFQAVDPVWEGGELNAVRVQLRPRNGNVNGSMRLIDLGGRNYKVYDLTFEGSSLLLTYRSQYVGYLASRTRADGKPDFAGLIQMIQNQTSTLRQQIQQQR